MQEENTFNFPELRTEKRRHFGAFYCQLWEAWLEAHRSIRPEVFCKKFVLWNFAKCTGKQSNFIKKETLAQGLSIEFCKISKNTFFHRTPLVAVSVYSLQNTVNLLKMIIIIIKVRPDIKRTAYILDSTFAGPLPPVLVGPDVEYFVNSYKWRL